MGYHRDHESQARALSGRWGRPCSDHLGPVCALLAVRSEPAVRPRRHGSGSRMSPRPSGDGCSSPWSDGAPTGSHSAFRRMRALFLLLRLRPRATVCGQEHASTARARPSTRLRNTGYWLPTYGW